MRKGVFNLPNAITLGRLAVIPVLIILMSFLRIDPPGRPMKLNFILSALAAFLVAFAMASDILDGYLARRFGATSTFGKFLDPLADKLLFITAMIMMIPLARIPAWIVIVFLTREMLVTALRGVAVDNGIVIAASRAGKYKSAFISSGIVGLLLHYPFFGVEWRLCGWVLLLPGFVLSVASGVHYVVGFFRAMRLQTSH